MPPFFELRDHGLCLEVILISGRGKNFMLSEVISILEEEGAEVVSASFSVIGDKIFHTLHAQVTHYLQLFHQRCNNFGLAEKKII